MLNAILNTIFVSIPEEIIWLVLTLILLKRYDLLDRYRLKKNIKWLAIPVIPMAVMVNIFRYVIIIPRVLATFGTLIMFYCLIIYMVIKTDITKELSKIKIVLCLLLSTCFIFVTDSTIAPFLMYYLNVPITDINNNIILNILVSFVPRLIQIAILFYILTKKFKYYAVLSNIFKNKFAIIMLNCFLGVLVILWFIVIILFSNYISVHNYSIFIKILSGLVIIFVPLALIGIFIATIIHFISYIDKNNRCHSNELDDID